MRDSTFEYESLPVLGRASLWMSNRLVVAQLRPGSWLDLLCGYRALLQRSRRNDSRARAFYALDYRLDRRLAEYGFHLTEHHLERTLPYEDDLFDNITILNGLEHLWDPQEVLAECHRALALGGALQVVVPTWFGKPFLEFLAFRLKNKQAYVEMNDHKLYYDERTLWPMLVRAGFQPRNIHTSRIKFSCSLYARATKAPGDRSPPRADPRM